MSHKLLQSDSPIFYLGRGQVVDLETLKLRSNLNAKKIRQLYGRLGKHEKKSELLTSSKA